MARLSSKAAIAPLQALCQRVISKTINPGSFMEEKRSLMPLVTLRIISENVLTQQYLYPEKWDCNQEYVKFDGRYYYLYTYIIFGVRQQYSHIPKDNYYILKVKRDQCDTKLRIYGMTALVSDQDLTLLTKHQLGLIAEADRPRRGGN